MTRVHVSRSAAATVAATLAVLAAASSSSGQAQPTSTSAASGPVAPTSSATEALAAEFPGLLQAIQNTGAPRARTVAPGNRVGRQGRGKLVYSTRPLLAGGAPVERALRDDAGALRPANPVVDATIATDDTGGFTVGEGDRGFGVRSDTPVASSDAEVLGDALIRDDARPSTDTIVRAVTGGIETFELLRDAGAPEQFRYALDSADTRLRPAADGAFEVVRGDEVVGHVSRPIATDASGKDVPIVVSTDGEALTLEVAHRDRGYAYPILVDPTWTADYDFSDGSQGTVGLSVDQSSPARYTVALTSQGAHPGITIVPIGGFTYTTNDVAKVSFAAPPGATISNATFADTYRYNQLHKQVMRFALYGPGVEVKNDWADNVDNTDDVTLDDTSDRAKFAQIWMFTAPCVANESNCPRFVPAGTDSRVTVGDLSVELVDPGVPPMSFSGPLRDLAGTWSTGAGQRTVRMGASDDGSGIYSWSLVADPEEGASLVDVIAERTEACNERHSTVAYGALVCPLAVDSGDVGFNLADLPEGRTTFYGGATDWADNDNDGDAQSWETFIDRTAPTIDDVGGDLTDTTMWTSDPGSEVTIAGLDEWSGVRELRYELRGENGGAVVRSGQADTCSPVGPVEEPCQLDPDHAFNVDTGALADGAYEIVGHATDYVGLSAASATPVPVRLDRTAPRATVRGGAAFEGKWLGSSDRLPLELSGRDATAGVASYKVTARDADGFRILDEVEVCDASDVDNLPQHRCPATDTRPYELDTALLADGKATVEFIAVDAAGNEDPSPQTLTLSIDRADPGTVTGLTAVPLIGNVMHVSWYATRADETATVTFEYRATPVTGGVPGAWIATRVPYADIEIPTGIATYVEVRQVDAAGNRGATRAIVITGATVQDVLVPRGRSVTIDIEEEAQKILKNANWAKFEKEIYEASTKAAVSGGFAVTASTAGKVVLKTVGGVVASTLGFLTLVDSTGCAMTYPVPPENTPAKRVFAHRIGIAARAVSAGFRAKPGATNSAKALIDTAQQKLEHLRADMQRQINEYSDQCDVVPTSYKVGSEIALVALKEVEKHNNETATKPVVEKKRPAKTKTKTKRRKRECDDKEANERGLKMVRGSEHYDDNYPYRWNLCWFTQRNGTAEKPEKAEAHHVLQRNFRSLWKKAGLENWQDPKYMCWMKEGQHGDSDWNLREKQWNPWWSFADRRNRVRDTPYWRREILEKAMAIHKIKVNNKVSHRCVFPPDRGSDRARRAWPVDAGQPSDFQPKHPEKVKEP